MSPSRLRLLALPTAPCKHRTLFFFSFAWRENSNPLPPFLRLHLEEKINSVTFDLSSKDSAEIHIDDGFSTFNLIYNASFSPCDFFFALGPRTSTHNSANKERDFFFQIKKKNWSKAETPVVFIQ